MARRDDEDLVDRLLRLLRGCAIAAAVALAGWAVANPLPLAAPPPAPEPLYRLSAAPEAGTVRLDGLIDFGATAGLERLIAAGGVRRLVLDSPGGLVAEARGLVRLVRTHRLATEVVRTCASACTLVFVAGAPRALGPEGRLGFHSYALRSGREGAVASLYMDPAAEQARDMALFRSSGVDDAFIARIVRTPASEMWYPDRDALVAAGVLTPGP